MAEHAGLVIGIATDRTQAHVQDVCTALAGRGARGVPFRLADCAFDSAAPAGLRLPGFADALPDAVFVRAIEGGGFEAVTRRLGILHALGTLGVPAVNSAKAMENCVDKSMTSFLLRQHGVATPPAWAVETHAAAATIVMGETALGHRLALKPLFGSQGRGLRLIRAAADLPEAPPEGEVFYLQRFVPPPGEAFEDHRLLMLRGKLVAAMTRSAPDWIVNIKQGGVARPVAPAPEMVALALAAAAAVRTDFAGVDIIAGAEGPQVIEVNSTPAWAGLQTVTNIDIAAAVADMLLRVASGRRGAC